MRIHHRPQPRCADYPLRFCHRILLRIVRPCWLEVRVGISRTKLSVSNQHLLEPAKQGKLDMCIREYKQRTFALHISSLTRTH